MIQRFRSTHENRLAAKLKKRQAEVELKKVREELANVKGELAAEKLARQKNDGEAKEKGADVKEWETEYWVEHTCCSKWEAEAKVPAEKYEDGHGSLKLDVQNIVVDDFLLSDHCKNILTRLGVQMVR